MNPELNSADQGSRGPGPAPQLGGFRAAPQPSPWRAFCGVWQLTYPRFLTLSRGLVLAGLLIVAGVIAHALVPSDVTGDLARGRYLSAIIAVFVSLLSPAFAFLSAAGSMRDDLSGRTVDYVLTRPMRRSHFVVFKYLAQVPAIQLQTLLALGVALLMGAIDGVPGLGPAFLPLALVQMLVVFAFAGLGLLCAVVTARYVVLGLVYGVIVEVGVGRIPTQLNRISLTQQARELLAQLDYAGAPEVTASVGTSVGIMLALTIIWVATAAMVFAVRELSASEEV